MQLIGSCIIVSKYTNNFMKIDLEPLFYSRLTFFINFENLIFLCKVLKTTLSPYTFSIEEHITTLKYHNFYDYYNIMYKKMFLKHLI
jgi:hypothetical protein